MNVTGIILCGGKSSRMGKNKAFLELERESLIDRAVRIFKDIFPEIMLVTNTPLEYLDQDVAVVTDIIHGKGALGGIFTGLFYASSEYVFVAPCDMPFLNRPFIEYLISQRYHHDIVVPRSDIGFQPLHAVYSRNCLREITKRMEAGELKISGLYEKLRTLEIREDKIRLFDTGMKMFFNVNSPEDFKKIS